VAANGLNGWPGLAGAGSQHGITAGMQSYSCSWRSALAAARCFSAWLRYISQ